MSVRFQSVPGPGRYAHFFGYYYARPVNSDNRLLGHRVGFDGRDIRTEDAADVGFWDLEGDEFRCLARTQAFNFQMGSMLQWMPGENNRFVIFNDRGRDHYISRIVDSDSGDSQSIPSPIYAVHPGGQYALSVNYHRIRFCRPGYHYCGFIKPEWSRPLHGRDGISRVCLRTGRTELLISTAAVSAIDPSPRMRGAFHWLDHMIWNRSGTRFAFLHRWTHDREHRTRLFTAAADGTQLYCFPDTTVYSHMGWRNDREFTIWGLVPSRAGAAIHRAAENRLVNRVLGPPYRLLKKGLPLSVKHPLEPRCAYLHCWDESDRLEVLGDQRLTHDGHNTWSDDQRWMLTDTYQDQTNHRHLLLFDRDSGAVQELGRFHSPFNDSTYRCDLHPRFDPSNCLVIIDSAHCDNRRQIYVLDISKIIGKTTPGCVSP